MARIRRIICLVFALACIVYGGYMVKSRLIEDHIPPQITAKSDTVKVSVKTKNMEKALLKGVTAEDNRDGDITDSIRISSMSHFKAKGKRTVTYVVFDESNMVGTLNRTVEYKDYVSPRIYMEKPLRYSETELDKMNMTADMTAEDCLDGDLSNQIRTMVDGDSYNMKPGTYTVTLQVNNSAGDVCTVPVELAVTGGDDREERTKEYPVLKEYIAYTSVDKEIKTSSYIAGLEKGGVEYTYKKDGAMLAGTKDKIKVKSNVDYSKPGVYTVEYSYKADGAPKAVTKLYVVVEGEEDGKE